MVDLKEMEIEIMDWIHIAQDMVKKMSFSSYPTDTIIIGKCGCRLKCYQVLLLYDW